MLDLRHVAALTLLVRLRRHVPNDEQDCIDATVSFAVERGFPAHQLETGEWIVRTDDDYRD